MITDFSCWAGVGDAYIVLLKIFGYVRQSGTEYAGPPIRMHHYCDQPQYLPAIRELFSIAPFVNGIRYMQSLVPPSQTRFPEILTTFERNTDKEYIRFEPFPNLYFADIQKFNLPNEYVSVSVRAGRRCQKRYIRDITLENIIKRSSLPVVLVGIDKRRFFNPLAINLVNRTSFMEACQVIRNSKMHYGFAGASCFIALSHKVPLKVWVKGGLIKRAMEIRTANEWRPFIVGENEYE